MYPGIVHYYSFTYNSFGDAASFEGITNTVITQSIIIIQCFAVLRTNTVLSYTT